jgi:hypothetical protein
MENFEKLIVYKRYINHYEKEREKLRGETYLLRINLSKVG